MRVCMDAPLSLCSLANLVCFAKLQRTKCNLQRHRSLGPLHVTESAGPLATSVHYTHKGQLEERCDPSDCRRLRVMRWCQHINS